MSAVNAEEAAPDWLSAGPEHVNTLCPHHDGRCAYDASSPLRCPWCHASWSVVLRTGWHSCEQASVWPGRQRRWRVEEARVMRLAAAQEVDQGTASASLAARATEVLLGPLSTPEGVAA